MGDPFSAAFPVDGVVMPIFSVFTSPAPAQALTNGSITITNARQITPVTISKLLLFIYILLEDFNHLSLNKTTTLLYASFPS